MIGKGKLKLWRHAWPHSFGALTRREAPQRRGDDCVGAPLWHLKQRLATVVTAAIILCGAASAAAAQCLPNTREIKFPDGSARVRNYVCKLPEATDPQIRVEFDRLNEVAAGGLIEGSAYPELQTVFQTPRMRVMDNPVQAEVKRLFDQFGTRSVDEAYYQVGVIAAAKGGDYSKSTGEKSKRMVWYLGTPEPDPSPFSLSLPQDEKYIQESNNWPPGSNFYYRGCDPKENPISCTILWRSGKSMDIRGLGQNKYPGLVDYLAQGGLPNDFLLIVEYFGLACGDYPHIEFDFSVDAYFRQLILDVALVENISMQEISLDGLLGTALAGPGLRREEPGPSGSARAQPVMQIPKVNLAPGETVAIPLRISFVPSKNFSDLFDKSATSGAFNFGNKTAATATFERIQAAAPGTIFNVRELLPQVDKVRDKLVKKIRESFGPPTVPPAPVAYAYGPEINLQGLLVNGQRAEFDTVARNFVQLAEQPEGIGSCPILYVWDDQLSTWVRHGKVMHQANSKEKQATQTLSFSGFASMFRLSEEEPEISYIDQAKLSVELANGTKIDLLVDDDMLAAIDGNYALIRPDKKIEFKFQLPAGIKIEDVTKSTLAITGYYRPYSGIRIGQQ